MDTRKRVAITVVTVFLILTLLNAISYFEARSGLFAQYRATVSSLYEGSDQDTERMIEAGGYLRNGLRELLYGHLNLEIAAIAGFALAWIWIAWLWKDRQMNTPPASTARNDGKPNVAPGNVSANLSAEALGLPGTAVDVVIVPQYEGVDPRNTGKPGGIPGDYKVEVVLSRPGFAIHQERNYFAVRLLSGDSHLAIAAPAVTIAGNPTSLHLDVSSRGQSIRANLIPNADGYLSKIVVDSVHAPDSRSAEELVLDAIAPWLSVSSFMLNIPMHVQQVDVTELFTGTIRMRLTNGFLRSTMQMPTAGPIDDELRGIISLHREATETNSPRYQFLLVFTIIEALTARRKKLARAAARAGLSTSKSVENIPITDLDCVAWLESVFPSGYRLTADDAQIIIPQEVRGLPLADVVESKFRPLRINIAHAIFSGQELSHSMDRVSDRRDLLTWLPLAMVASRLMTKNDFPSAGAAFPSFPPAMSPPAIP